MRQLLSKKREQFEKWDLHRLKDGQQLLKEDRQLPTRYEHLPKMCGHPLSRDPHLPEIREHLLKLRWHLARKCEHLLKLRWHLARKCERLLTLCPHPM